METQVILDDEEYIVVTVAVRRAIQEIRQVAARAPLPPDMIETLATLERAYAHLKGSRITSIIMPQILRN